MRGNITYELVILTSLILAFTLGAFAQEKMEKGKPTDKDKTEAIPTTSYMKCGAAIGSAQKVLLAKVLADPTKFWQTCSRRRRYRSFVQD